MKIYDDCNYRGGYAFRHIIGIVQYKREAITVINNHKE
jgi:hypothetical protein